ncbi:MAG: hypothetical protein QGH60_03760 [Phycisphaerae bacterium]|jgi:hypothetical protein|nr:hypothetical protein [Phycisphaerae bacterium]
MSDEKKRNWFVRIVRVVVCLCLLGVIGVWVVKIWILPSLVRREASSYLDDVWVGTIEIEDVDVNIFGPSHVRGVTVCDNLNRTWVSVPEVRIDVAWDGFVPRLRAVRIGVVNLSPQFVDGQCTVPLKLGESSDDPDDIVRIINDLKEIEITVGIVTLCTVSDVSTEDRTMDGVVLPPAFAQAISQANIIFPDIGWKGGKLSIDRALGEIGDDPVSVQFSGGLQDDRSIEFRGEGLLLAPEEVVSGAFEVRLKPGGMGHFQVSLVGQVHAGLRGEIQGYRVTKVTLDVLASNIQPDKFEWLIGPDETVWLALESSKVVARIEATCTPNGAFDAAGRIDLSGPIGETHAIVKGQYAPDGAAQGSAKITGTLCGGNLQADVKAVLHPDLPVQLTIEASAEKVSMADLTRILAADKVMTEGIGGGVIRMTMSGSDLASMSGRGAFFLDDADLWQVPLFSALFKHMNLKLDKADIESSFDLEGTTATIITGQLATMLWAAEFEKGGTVDIDSGKIDMYVLFLPVKQAGLLLNLVKAINPLRLVAKEVFRLHVTGTKADPTITPVPFSDLTKLPLGALGLLKSVTTSGGQLGGDIFKAVLGGGG